MTLFENKYRVESARLKGWNYSSAGFYYVTICTKNRECYLGEIVDGVMHLSEIGGVVLDEWRRTEKIRPGVILDAFMIMPNHLHGIVGIKNDNVGAQNVETHCNASLRDANINNLSNVIRGFKSTTTKYVHENITPEFAWQARFHDHIIRDERSLHQIREYILVNPLKWDFDRNNFSSHR